MALVSISEAARLTGKSRTTVQSYIKCGKLTKCAGGDGSKKIDTSELLRVFGPFNGQQVGSEQKSSSVHSFVAQTVQVNDQYSHDENRALKAEIELVKALLREKDLLLAEKDKRNDDLKHALLLIESKLPKNPEPIPEPVTPAVTETVALKKPWQFWRK
ncbi:helix-turn-helix domain-containing protein [Rosenbergiella epipactidis]|uniref:helix-turn-helix domain-containing protein n=1 Tax=Rosenbergiella epipactidis TaxID=1544694 RepID=UPI001F4FECEC|nr:helix-turn-helix domain-containing protein [Rosenbergiella epipactidis]